MSLKRILLKTCSVLLLGACGSMPASGPYSQLMNRDASVEILAQPEKSTEGNRFRYAVVGLNSTTLDVISGHKMRFFNDVRWPEKAQPEIIKVNVGDTIQVTIYEAQSGGLFIPKEAGVRPGNFISLPPQTIDRSGYITVPYVGLVQAAGRTTGYIGKSITASLADRAIEPQVVVSFSNRNSSEVSVIGAVEEATRFSLNFNGDKILDAIARAGGPSSPGYETWVSLQRDDAEYTISFDQLIMESKKNIFMKANDTVYLYREPKTFIVYGAAQSQGSIPFGKRDLRLSEALGLANGLRDIQADPAEIYIYRHERIDYFDKLAKYATDVHMNVMNGDTTPVIYKLDLRNPSGFFWAQKFSMRDKDVIYVANAKSVEFLKFLNILNNTAVTATSVKNTKSAYE